MIDWASAFGGLKSFLSNGQNLSNMGNLVSGAGSLYSAINGNKLIDKQISTIDKSNDLALRDYKEEEKRRKKIDNSFSDIWG